ncbi:alpha-amylase [Burkholderia ubonensis]|uniref:maltose alpha-D-glucosyltransferase n=1 Tax=Burkholderia ubonensis TaxID=101571 RepID=UPI000757078D|nr:maltose alpha-D-glucosyltransferase [Burkholderia ubonensis]KVV44583.1 alpha-amylase [Burkholderia ubonensis]
MKREPYFERLTADPLWYKDAVIYQLHVKSFFDANNDGIGDFAGLQAKLDYIAELGVDAIWLLPFYPSPRRDDGYDISAYRDVHADYGKLGDIKRLIAAAHARGIRVITELVINHTSDEHPWFQRARRAKPGSSHRNYYVWSDTGREYAGTRVIFLDTEVSNWSYDEVAGAYFWHRFYSHQPDLNFDNPQVVKEVLGVMHFWLDLGVDGLRLDAVPYLVVREGTSNENLPETHEILRRIRADLDARYRNRMLLAEANQWPEDVQQYFGSGDECHMAFHFPLMPRMYMAIAREDRFPITDILWQTPQIPPTCQWAIFLRNHDELTLEMVTDSERDYLWEVYASDRRARLNLGIRRRLAPLLERDRRRIELMNSLLLSMPGTPVIYYGDEIGMGDNIHLGDRDGVRTPMQWSFDRNGGFSRADPEQLTLPPIQGALYGYESVNVESQSRDPHSLLNWTRRLIATRRSHHAFGRGAIEFLQPVNRKVLAYLREYENDPPLLCVANLSRASQAVELDLSRFAKRTPVELLGGSAFPSIGQLTYLLTLPPYGFYWFELSDDTQAPRWNAEPAEQLPEFITLVWRAGEPVLSSAHRQALEQKALPQYLPRRRWFASKNGKLHRARLEAITALEGTPTPTFLCEVESEIETDGKSATERYLLPLAVAWDQPGLPPLPGQLALARIRCGPQVGFLTDAFAVAPFARALCDAMRRQARLPVGGHADGDVIECDASAALTAEMYRADAEINWIAAEQTNSTLAIGHALALKLVRRVVAGAHPEAEMGRYLSEHGFANAPAWLGEVRRRDAAGTPHTLAILQAFVENQGNAWDWAFETLTRLTEELSHETDVADASDDDTADYTRFAGVVGRRLGEMHGVLAQPSEQPDFAPRRATPDDCDVWAARVRAQVDDALDLLALDRQWSDKATAQLARRLVDQRAPLLALAERLCRDGAGTSCQRIHGDFHLGQVLVVQGDACLIDFEGEPVRPLAERREKASPLRDVAGLLRSLDYVGYAVTHTGEQMPQPLLARRDAFLRDAMDRAATAFLDAYRTAVGTAPPGLAECAGRAALLDAFLLEKAAYEIVYEFRNRPAWVPVPLRGMAELARRLLARHGEAPRG